MMLAAYDAGRYGDVEPPAELQTAWQIKRWNALPETGGLLEQPAGLLRRAGVLHDYYTAGDAYRGALMRGGKGLQDWEVANYHIMELVGMAETIRRRSNGS